MAGQGTCKVTVDTTEQEVVTAQKDLPHMIALGLLEQILPLVPNVKFSLQALGVTHGEQEMSASSMLELLSFYAQIQTVMVYASAVQYAFFPGGTSITEEHAVNEKLPPLILKRFKEVIQDSKSRAGVESLKETGDSFLLDVTLDQSNVWLDGCEIFHNAVLKHLKELWNRSQRSAGDGILDYIATIPSHSTYMSGAQWINEQIEAELLIPKRKRDANTYLKAMLNVHIEIKKRATAYGISDITTDPILMHNWQYCKQATQQGHLFMSIVSGCNHVVRRSAVDVTKGPEGQAAKCIANAAELHPDFPLPAPLLQRLNKLVDEGRKIVKPKAAAIEDQSTAVPVQPAASERTLATQASTVPMVALRRPVKRTVRAASIEALNITPQSKKRKMIRL